MIKVNNIDEEIRKAQRNLAELEAAKKSFLEMTEEQRLAEALHELKCHWNHTDGCGWYYEINREVVDWNGYAHNEWLKKAEKLLKISDYDTILETARNL